MATKKIPALRVVATTGRPSYRAIGRAFSGKATDIAVADLSKAQIVRLKTDPWLSVTEVEVDRVVPDDAAADVGDGAGSGQKQ